MKKLKRICLSLIICLSLLVFGRAVNPMGLNFASASEFNNVPPTSNNSTVRQPGRQAIIQPRDTNPDAVADNGLDNNGNININNNSATKPTENNTANTSEQNNSAALDSKTTSGEVIDQPATNQPVYGFEMHAWGKIWVMNPNEDIDPGFSYNGTQDYGIMLIDKGSKQQEDSTNKTNNNNNSQLNNSVNPSNKNINSNNVGSGSTTVQNNTNNTATNNSQNNTTPSTQVPSIYPTNPAMPRHNTVQNNIISNNRANMPVTPRAQKPTVPKTEQENNSTTNQPSAQPRTNNLNKGSNNHLIPNNKIAAPYSHKTSTSLGAVKFSANKIPKAVFVKKSYNNHTNNSNQQLSNNSKVQGSKATIKPNAEQNTQKTANLPVNDQNLVQNKDKNANIANKTASNDQNTNPMMAIVIDDFGGYERTGVDALINGDVPITCAVIPFADNSDADYQAAVKNNKEVILHMPMEAHVNLPKEWYGTIYIANWDTPQTAIEKLEKCLASMPQAKGFNFHIGSGVNRNLELMKALYHYALTHNMFFLDSRTIVDGVGEKACSQEGGIYLGRDVFLEPEKNRSYQGVYNRLEEGMKVAQEKGVSVVIGHVGAEGGENTAKCILDHAQELAQKYGVQIVPISQIYSRLTNKV